MQNITVIGPNLPSHQAKLGSFHVHASDCKDVVTKYRQVPDHSKEAFEAGSRQEVAEWTYYDQLNEGACDLASALHDHYFAPCVTLPELAEPTPTSQLLDELQRERRRIEGRIESQVQQIELKLQSIRRSLEEGLILNELGELQGRGEELDRLIAQRAMLTEKVIPLVEEL